VGATGCRKGGGGAARSPGRRTGAALAALGNAVRSELPDWIGAHVDALAFLGGVPKALVCD
jgi:hypothetical protein